MPIMVESRRKKPETLQKKYPDASIIDVTSKADQPWVQLSPFYPHGEIPVPFSGDMVGQSVEGIWQGLKVFENAEVDIEKSQNRTMRNLKRTVRRFGKVLGHREGVNGTTLLSYLEARWKIYLPVYRFVLENKVSSLIEQLTEQSRQETILLLDYETNGDINDLSRPLSHAHLIARYVENNWPQRDEEV